MSPLLTPPPPLSMGADAIWHKMGPDRVRVTLPRLGEGDVDLSLGRGAAGQHCARLPARTWLGLGLGLGFGLELGFGVGSGLELGLGCG